MMRKRKKCLIKLEETLSEGDGVEVWVKVGGRVGTIVENLTVNGNKVGRSSSRSGSMVCFTAESKAPATGYFLLPPNAWGKRSNKCCAMIIRGQNSPCDLDVKVAPGQPPGFSDGRFRGEGRGCFGRKGGDSDETSVNRRNPPSPPDQVRGRLLSVLLAFQR